MLSKIFVQQTNDNIVLPFKNRTQGIVLKGLGIKACFACIEFNYRSQMKQGFVSGHNNISNNK